MVSEFLLTIWETIKTIWDALKDPNIWVRIALSAFLLVMLISLSLWQRTNLESKLIWSFLRGLIQIVIFGSFLTLVFGIEHIWIQYLILILMCVFAAFTNYQSYPYPKMFLIGLLTITLSSLLVMSFVIFSGAIFNFIETPSFTLEGIIPYPPTGEYVVPMGSMVISFAMRISGIALERTKSDIVKSRGTIEAALALGSTSRNAIQNILTDSYKAGLIPTINRVSTLGIVSIPGLMAGMIIGGVPPIEAAIYQIVIFLMLLSSSFLTSILTNILFTRQFFTNNHQFNLEFLNQLTALEQRKFEKKLLKQQKKKRKLRGKKKGEEKISPN
ncbi:MAG: ABC transporter permease [Candidatus Heimdallarchaeota archaeon]